MEVKKHQKPLYLSKWKSVLSLLEKGFSSEEGKKAGINIAMLVGIRGVHP